MVAASATAALAAVPSAAGAAPAGTDKPVLAKVGFTVNGERRSIAAGSTLGDLLRSLELDPRTVVVEHNGVVLRDRDAYDSLTLAADDNVEIVHFVGGG